MRKFSRLRKNLLSPSSAVLAVVSALLLVLAFPDFELWPLAWIALGPLFFAVERERDSVVKSFLTGWLFGLVFFFGTCWWLTFAPITYAAMPWPLVYFFMVCVAATVGVFPGIFAALLSVLLKRRGGYAIIFAPFLWTFTEFLRMWLTGNNWNAIGYSQAFNPFVIYGAEFGGVLLISFLVVGGNTLFYSIVFNRSAPKSAKLIIGLAVVVAGVLVAGRLANPNPDLSCKECPRIVAVQPNVPMDGLTYEKYERLLRRHFELAENALKERTVSADDQTTIVFPESPMIFQYGRDDELQKVLGDFAVRNHAALLFNSAEPTRDGKRVMNSAVMIDAAGRKVGQYDKIHLLPFGEYIPFPEPLASAMPAFVGNFQFGDEYDLLPFGSLKGGVMICFESHFGDLSREYASRGADLLVEMTNDGYLGKTPVLRQHLANSVFRAVETNRPLVRVTNVGVTALIDANGGVHDAADVYAEATRVWTVAPPDKKPTIYVRFGEWFAWLCSIASLGLILSALLKRKGLEE
ncbi:MAG: apolipoprotein N-acyltransferase [Acidobacteria bacterium]|nr:apolipoprotein N-acyltransferase [Acidobacteriota bacterium]